MKADGETRPGVATAKVDKARAALLSQATTAGRTTMAPNTAGGLPESATAGLASRDVTGSQESQPSQAHGVTSSVGTSGAGAMMATTGF